MNKTWIVAKQVFRKNVKSWSFFWMVFSPFITLAIVGLVAFFIGRDAAQSSIGEIAVVDAPSEVVLLIQQADTGNEIHFDLSMDEARSQLESDQIEGYLVWEDDLTNLKYYRKTTSKDIDTKSIASVISNYQMLEQAKELGISDQDLMKLQNQNVFIDKINVSFNEGGETKEVSTSNPAEIIKMGAAYGVCFLVFFFIINYVSIISQEIAAEKGSRIMEIILSSISATSHFLGKLLGIAMVIAAQIAIYIIIGLILWFIKNQFAVFTDLTAQLPFDLSMIFKESGPVIYLGLLYALLGIIMYTSLSGFLGSLVSKTEDVNKMVSPLVFIGVAGFYIGMYAFNSTNNPVVRIGSQFPLFTPFVMPLRIAAGTVSAQEIVISVILSIVFAIILLMVSMVFYKSNVLVYSDKGMINTLKRSYQLWKSERSSL